MRHSSVLCFAFAALILAGPAAASDDRSGCPKWEPGTRYPWQSNTPMRDDVYATLILEADQNGYVRRCTIVNDNYEGAEDRFWMCKQYKDNGVRPRPGIQLRNCGASSASR